MMMMIPQKNVESSPKKCLKHMCKKKNCGDDDDGTECSFLLTSSSVPSSSTEFSFCICDSEICLEKISHFSVASSSDINRVFFLHMCFRSLFGEDCTFFCGIIIWHQHSFLFACVLQNFVWRRLHILWHHHHQHSFLLHVFSVSLFGEVCILLPPPSSSSPLLFPFLFLHVSQKQDLILFRIRQTRQATNHFLHTRWRRRRR